MGDSSDNIPGVPGVGPKTAQKLIKQFDTIENLLQNTDQLKGKQKERVEQNRDQALMSKELVTIKCDVPLDVTPDELKAAEYNEDQLRTLFEELAEKQIVILEPHRSEESRVRAGPRQLAPGHLHVRIAALEEHQILPVGEILRMLEKPRSISLIGVVDAERQPVRARLNTQHRRRIGRRDLAN